MFCERLMGARGARRTRASLLLSALSPAPGPSTVPEPTQGPQVGCPAQGCRFDCRKSRRSQQPEGLRHGEKKDRQGAAVGSLISNYGPTVNPFGNWRKGGPCRAPEHRPAKPRFGPTVDPFG